jgi:hypothetical protein
MVYGKRHHHQSSAPTSKLGCSNEDRCGRGLGLRSQKDFVWTASSAEARGLSCLCTSSNLEDADSRLVTILVVEVEEARCCQGDTICVGFRGERALHSADGGVTSRHTGVASQSPSYSEPRSDTTSGRVNQVRAPPPPMSPTCPIRQPEQSSRIFRALLGTRSTSHSSRSPT